MFPCESQHLQCGETATCAASASSVTYFLLHSTLQHNRRPYDAVVTLVQVVVLGRVEVRQDEYALKVRVLCISKLLHMVRGHERSVDVLKTRARS